MWLCKLDLKPFVARHHSDPDVLFLDRHASQRPPLAIALAPPPFVFRAAAVPYHQLLQCESPARGAASLGRQGTHI
jgi:hypothetical protein